MTALLSSTTSLPVSEMSILPSWLDPTHFIEAAGPWATVVMMAVLFAECGLLIGFFLPGDTMLFIAGLLVASHRISVNLAVLIVLLWLAAFAGNMVGYGIGRRFGPAVFARRDAKYLKREYIERSEGFFARYGSITVVLARFVPIVRTVATVMAGASKMNARLYTVYSAIGGLLWVGVVTVAGYFLGKIAFIRDNVDLIFIGAVVVVVAFAAVPALLHVRNRRRSTDPH